MEPFQEKVKAYYEQTHQSYKNWDKEAPYALHYGFVDSPSVNHSESLKRMNETMANMANIRPNSRVLDAGCGVGCSAFWLAEHRQARVYGINISPLQLQFAQTLQVDPQRVCLPVEFSLRDYTNTGFASAVFDVVWGLESVCHTEYKEDFLQEAYRLLKPGGRLVVADLFMNDTDLSEMKAYALQMMLEGWAIPNMYTADSFLDHMESVGFRDVVCSDVTKQIEPSANEIYRRAKDGYPDDILMKDKNITQIKHVHACLYQKIALDLGVWQYKIFVGYK